MYYFKVVLYLVENCGNIVELAHYNYETEIEARREQFRLMQEYSLQEYRVECIKAIKPMM